MSTPSKLSYLLDSEHVQHFLSSLCNFLPHYVFWKDKNSVYLGCNENYARMIGLDSPEAIIGLRDTELPGNYFRLNAADFIDGDKQTIAGSPIVNKEYVMPQANGELCTFLVNKKAIYDHNGLVLGVLGFVTDITEQKKTALELLVAKQQAEDAAQEIRTKSDYIANISHDLRTPLNGVVGMSERLKRLNLDEKHQETIDCIIQGSHTLLSLVDDILNVARLEAGKLPVHHQHFNLKILIEEALSTITFAAQQKEITLKIDYAPETPLSFIGDANRIKRIVLNLLGNAIKFTDHGHIMVLVKEKSREGKLALLDLAVQDTGAGIPADKLAKIFDRFETGEDAARRSEKHGAGLGLTIVKEFIEGMGGNIHVESQEKTGSTFHCTLPLEIHFQKQRQSAWAEQFPDVRILMINDVLDRSKALLAEIGHEHLTTITSQKIIDLLEGHIESKDFNIIFISDSLTDLDAASLCHLLHENHRFSKAMKIVFGAAKTTEYEEYLKQQGGFATLVWQDSYIETLSSLAKYWQNWEYLQASQIGKLKELHAKILLVEDNPLNQKAISILLEDAGCEVCLASNGQEALDFSQHSHFDILFLDLGLPDMNGIEVARRIRERENGNCHLPIVALTGHVQNESKDSCIEAGMDWFLAKPLSVDALQAALARILLR